MVYVPFVSDTPDITDTGAVVINNTRENLMALRDAIVAGALVDWDMAATGGTAEEPTQILYSKGTERVRLTVTWGTTGGEDGNPKTIVYAYDGDGGASYDTIGTWTGTYDASGNLTAETWS
jgi:hypothetical protein